MSAIMAMLAQRGHTTTGGDAKSCAGAGSGAGAGAGAGTWSSSAPPGRPAKLYVVGVAPWSRNKGISGQLFFRQWRDGVGAAKEALEEGTRGLVYRTFASVEEALKSSRVAHLRPFQAMSQVAWEQVPPALRTRDNVLPFSASAVVTAAEGGEDDDDDEDPPFPFTQRTPPPQIAKKKRPRHEELPLTTTADRSMAQKRQRVADPIRQFGKEEEGSESEENDDFESGFVVVTDGSAGSRNGQRSAPCGLGFMVREVDMTAGVRVESLVVEGGRAGDPTFDGAIAPVNTSPRAEWQAMALGMKALIKALMTTHKERKLSAMTLTLACDNLGVVAALQRQLSKPRVVGVTTAAGLRNAATNQDVKLLVVNLLHLSLRPHFHKIQAIHTPAHMSSMNIYNLAQTDPFLAWLCVHNARVDELASQGTKEYERMRADSVAASK